MFHRRKLILSALSAGLGMGPLSRLAFAQVPAASPPTGQTRRLIVMTSYPQEVISRYLDAFAKAAPDVRIDIVWHSGDDARDYLLGDGKGKVDVYWSPSVRTFIDLAAKGAFRKLNVDRKALPGKIGKQAISDPNGYYEASEIAGYGFVCNPAYLKRLGLAEPADWTDLADPAYAGHVTMPVPSRIGFAPTITEIVLQSHGWKGGWALLAAIAANARLQTGRGDDAMNEVAQGKMGVGLTIDFFAAQAIARGAPLTFRYPKANAFEPANIAIATDAPDEADAGRFVDFVLSDTGQRLLIDPDLRRLAIRPAVYADAPKDYFNPWAAGAAKDLSFDNAVFARRRALDNALFDRMIVAPRDRAQPLWEKIRQIETHGTDQSARSAAATAKSWLGTVPLTEAQADALAPSFDGHHGKSPALPAAQEAMAQWDRTMDDAIGKAAAALDGVQGR